MGGATDVARQMTVTTEALERARQVLDLESETVLVACKGPQHWW